MREEYSSTSSQAAVAETLHELGVLSLRRHNIASAAAYLHRSLEIKRMEGRNYTDTLHQLAVVATTSGRYDEAERALLSCLELEPVLNGSRAATLQQLGRVCLRRGQLSSARQNFESSIAIYLSIYGEDTKHLNVAGVYHQLGTCATMAGDYLLAREYFQKALAIKEVVYSDTDNTELVVEIQSLGQTEESLGNLELAKALFSRARGITTRLLDELAKTATADESKRGNTYVAGESAEFSVVLNAAVLSIYSLRSIAKQQDDALLATQLGKEARSIRTKYASSKKKSGNSPKDKEVVILDDVDLVHKLSSLRSEVRSLASSLVSLAREESMDEVRARLRRVICATEELLQHSDRKNAVFADELRVLVSAFLSGLNEALSEDCCGDIKRLLFSSSDKLRDGLRSLGITVEDRNNTRKHLD